MPNFVSPGVYVIEKDISEYTPATNPSIVGVVGFADKGEPHKPTLITSPTQLVSTFGEPSDDLAGQGIQGALEILAGPNGTNQLWFVRAIDDNSAQHSAASLSLGACPALLVNEDIFTGATEGLWIEITVRDNNSDFGFPEEVRTFHVPSPNGQSNAEALRQAIGGSLISDKVGVFWDNDDDSDYLSSNYGVLVGFAAGENAEITARAYTSADKGSEDEVDAAFVALGRNGEPLLVEEGEGAGEPDWQTTSTAKGWTYAAGSFDYRVESLWPGAGYNEVIGVGGAVKGNAVATEPAGGDQSVLYVYENGSILENFTVSLGSEAFVESVINTGNTETTSEIIRGNLRDTGSTFEANPILFTKKISVLLGNAVVDAGGAGDIEPRFSKFMQGGIGLGGGNSGAEENTTASLVGNAATLPKTGMQALDVEGVPITMAIVPGITDEAVQNELVALAERTNDFIAVLGTPLAIGNAQNAIDWHNGKLIRTSPINSSYAAIYYPAVKVFNPYLGRDIFMDPGVYGVKQMCFTDSVADPWFAPAGFVRGRLLKPTEVEVDLSQGDRDSLYSGGNAINPIVNFPQRGITIFGQRTAQRDPTALDRINVRRLLLVVKRVILDATQRFVFEPNDEITWEKVKATLDPFLDDIRRRRGINEFKVVCDETTNTPVRVDRNELWCKVLIKPTKTAEVIVFELNITNQSTNLS
tara:strand:+ start:1989 stop:4085 length:2097 start_codon:yes stop_codon:yes gene_type:complete